MHSFYFMMFFTVAIIGSILAIGWASRQTSCPRCGHSPATEFEAPLLNQP